MKKEILTFKANDKTWRLIEVPQETFFEDIKIDKEKEEPYYFGRTNTVSQEIWICSELTIEQKLNTLYHELLHCYRFSYITVDAIDDRSEEFWCDVMANSQRMMQKVSEAYREELMK